MQPSQSVLKAESFQNYKRIWKLYVLSQTRRLTNYINAQNTLVQRIAKTVKCSEVRENTELFNSVLHKFPKRGKQRFCKAH